MMKRIGNLLPHVIIVLSGIFLVFSILDTYNPTMEFMSNSVSVKIFWVFCVLTMINAGIAIYKNNKSE